MRLLCCSTHLLTTPQEALYTSEIPPCFIIFIILGIRERSSSVMILSGLCRSVFHRVSSEATEDTLTMQMMLLTMVIWVQQSLPAPRSSQLLGDVRAVTPCPHSTWPPSPLPALVTSCGFTAAHSPTSSCLLAPTGCTWARCRPRAFPLCTKAAALSASPQHITTGPLLLVQAFQQPLVQL